MIQPFNAVVGVPRTGRICDPMTQTSGWHEVKLLRLFRSHASGPHSMPILLMALEAELMMGIHMLERMKNAPTQNDRMGWATQTTRAECAKEVLGTERKGGQTRAKGHDVLFTDIYGTSPATRDCSSRYLVKQGTVSNRLLTAEKHEGKPHIRVGLTTLAHKQDIYRFEFKPDLSHIRHGFEAREEKSHRVGTLSPCHANKEEEEVVDRGRGGECIQSI
ncbi:hypothetical protein F5887DRAFT_923740 [Amanita rubescens]|nr:hypothetical protein F5887DRAFT_923740 [Amanita rubescens]